ncbi:glycoside hydrolase family 95 protein [Parapedobacter lycopersici]|uniref:glycoside hydrolase family 95 protein n=1 Tax=Parapedobacter lycopersici TaxID=1864939 RepID=UPI00214DEF27|nr:glycoside hydrolase family 95 protein [Parapedobacter lycopersici]
MKTDTINRRLLLVAVFSVMLGGGANAFQDFPSGIPPEDGAHILMFNQPAETWLEALPVGNGRLGAMVFGNPQKEHIQLNEDSLWPDENGWDLAEGNAADLQVIRELLIAGENRKADALFEQKFLTKDIIRSHQTLGDLWIDFGDVTYTGYRRTLDLRNALATASFEDEQGSRVKQQVFASYPDDALVITYTTESEAGLTASISIGRPMDAGHETARWFTERDCLVMQGEVTQYNAVFKGGKDPITSGVKFDARVKVRHTGGTVEYTPHTIELTGVKAFTVFLVVNTSFYHRDYAQRSRAQLEAVVRKDTETLRDAHIRDYQALYSRVQLDIDHEPVSLPTDERLERVKNGAVDAGLETLLFDYGRYLLISSSRKGSLPANLQGLWNNQIEAPWNADYHLNINLQMNYWLANVTQLDELNESMFDYIDRLVENGKVAAKQNYGGEGSFLPHATDIWATSFLRSRTAYWGASFGAGGWMMQHYWNHYLFTQDEAFLRDRAFPAMQEVAKFYSSWIIENPHTGKLVSAPSSSPENRFINEKGDTVALCLGSAKDQQVIHELFTNYLRAAELLSVANTWTATIAAQLPRLRLGIQLGADGRILEWDKAYREPEPGHRHMSHLYAFHPGNAITQYETPELIDAVRKSMDYRMEHGGGHTGWSRAWLINLQARLLDGELAHENIQLLFQKSIGPNLFDLHPPFQIDGNFGYTAGVAEMLIQSHENRVVRILPALPAAWKAGTVKGLKARGNITVDIRWENGRAVAVRLESPIAQTLTMIINGEERQVVLQANRPIVLGENLHAA